MNTQTTMRAPAFGPPAVPGFLLGELVGRGATSSVWSAVRAETGEAVAIKVTAPTRLHVGQLMELAARETAILARVEHEHLVRLHEAHPLPDGSVAVVLDLAGGGNLADLVAARGRLEPGEVATICTPLAGALAALHAAGVVHGDLSPGNVVFTADGRPLLTDFDAARLVGESHPPLVAGTTGFVAPEVLAGDVPTEASDVFGLGALAWFALTGRPWGGPTLGAGSPTASASAPLEPAEAQALLGPGFAPAVVAMLADDPGARPSAVEAAVLGYRAATPAPVRLVSSPGADPDQVLTQRLRGREQRASMPGGPAPTAARPERRPRRRRGRHAAPGRPRASARGERVRARGIPPRPAEPARSARGSRRTRPRLLLGVAASLIVAVVAVAATILRVSPAAAADGDARQVLSELVTARGAALVSRSAEALGAADGPGTPQLAHDREIVAALHESGQRYADLSFTVRAADWLSSDTTSARVRAVVERSAYRVLGPGAAQADHPADPGAAFVYVLVRTDGGWRIADVAR